MSRARSMQRASKKSDLIERLMTNKKRVDMAALRRMYIKQSRVARFVVGCLIRATGQEADLVAVNYNIQDQYHQNMAERGLVAGGK